MHRKTVIKNLEYNYKWVENHFDDADRAQNLVIGCLQLLSQCNKSIEFWIAQKRGRRGALRQIHKLTTQKRNVLIDLLILTLSELGASIWVEDFWIGALPIKSSKQLTDAHKKAMAKGRTEGAKRRRRTKQEMIEARKQAKSKKI